MKKLYILILIFSISSIIFCLVALIAYILIGVKVVENCFGLINIKFQGISYKFLILFYSLLIPVALTISRNVTFISNLSSISIFSFLLFVFYMIYEGSNKLKKFGISSNVIKWTINQGFFSALSVFSLVFAFSNVLIPIINLSGPNLEKKKNSINISFIVSFSIVAIPGILGYLSYGSECKPNILDSLPNNIFTFIVRTSYFLIANASYVLISYPVSSMIGKNIYNIDNAIDLIGFKRFIILFLTSVIPVSVSIFLPNIRPALSIGGALGGCLSCFVYPSLLWLKSSEESLYHWYNIGCIFIIIFGIISTIISTYVSIIDSLGKL